MEIKEIQNLIKFVAKSGAQKIKLKTDDFKITIVTKGSERADNATTVQQVPVNVPVEAVKTNVIGAANLIDASRHNQVKKVVALSTDKASSPINLYGATKLVSDKLFVAANNTVGEIKIKFAGGNAGHNGLRSISSKIGDYYCLLYTSPSPRDATLSRMPSSA